MNYSSVLRLLMIWCLILIPLFGIAQNEQVIVGQIIDGTTLHPVANATIRFSKTLIVAHSNSEGYFFLRSDGSHTKVDFSAQGYASRHLRIKPNRSAAINIKLRPLKGSELPLEVCRQDTVAKSIILQVIQHKPVNNPEVGFHPSTESERLKAYVYHLPPDWIQGTQVADAATYSMDSLCSLPLFTEDRIYRQPNFPSVREDKELFFNKELSVSPLGKEYVRRLVGLLLPHQNFYDNKVILLGHYFISPIADNATLHYAYFMKDSDVMQGRKIYTIGFLPLRRNDFVLKGFLSVDSASLAITHISVCLPRNININFIHSISVDQSFAFDRGQWYYHKIDNFLTLELAPVGASYKKPFEIAIAKNLLFAPPRANDEDLKILHREREVSLVNPTNDSLYQRLSRFNNTHFMKQVTWLTNLFMYQYAHVGKIDIGPFNQLYHNNAIDGPTAALALRTNQFLWKRFSIGGNIGYAYRDHSWKFGGTTLYRLPTKHFQQIDLQYNKNAYQTGFNEDIYLVSEGKVSPSDNDVFSSFFRYKPDTVANEVASWRFRYQREWTREFKTTLTLFDNCIFSNQYIQFVHDGTPVESFWQRGIKIDFRFSRDQLIWDNCFDRRYLSNQYPVIHFQLEGGNYDFDQTNGDYLKLVSTINHSFSFEGGTLSYVAEAGYILGHVPFPLLSIARGNETYSFSAYNFNLMNDLEYAGDKYVHLHIHYYSSGLLLNKIPIVKKLGLLESFSLKVAESGLSKGYNDIFTMPSGMQPIYVPYVEGGVGVYNILKVLGVESDWRITHRNDPNANKWGIRFFFYISL